MNKDAEREEVQSRTAACSCRKLQIKVTGAPAQVNSCTCLECQRRSGSALTYTAFFPDSAIVSLDGEYRSWRQERDSGRWHESSFCLVCGTWVFSRLEVLPGLSESPWGVLPIQNSKSQQSCFGHPGDTGGFPPQRVLKCLTHNNAHGARGASRYVNAVLIQHRAGPDRAAALAGWRGPACAPEPFVVTGGREKTSAEADRAGCLEGSAGRVERGAGRRISGPVTPVTASPEL